MCLVFKADIMHLCGPWWIRWTTGKGLSRSTLSKISYEGIGEFTRGHPHLVNRPRITHPHLVHRPGNTHSHLVHRPGNTHPHLVHRPGIFIRTSPARSTKRCRCNFHVELLPLSTYASSFIAKWVGIWWQNKDCKMYQKIARWTYNPYKILGEAKNTRRALGGAGINELLGGAKKIDEL